MKKFYLIAILVLILSLFFPNRTSLHAKGTNSLRINKEEYFEMPGLNVFVFQNTYPDGHQGGIEIIQHGSRVASCGNLRLSVSPGQWQPIPQYGEGGQRSSAAPSSDRISDRKIDKENNEISMVCRYPYESRDSKGFNPIIYPDLNLQYNVRVQAEGSSFKIIVDLEKPLPEKWVGQVGFNLELFPGHLYGKTYYMDNKAGIFPRQANGPVHKSNRNHYNPEPLAKGKKLIVAPETKKFRMTIENQINDLILLDGSLKHANGWFVVRSLIREGATKGAVEWKVTPNVIPEWEYGPIVHTSQVGYYPNQKKKAIIELDGRTKSLQTAKLKRIDPQGGFEIVLSDKPTNWGSYLRYKYAIFDFTKITEPGTYLVEYGDFKTPPFKINSNLFQRHVWQPTLEYFLPNQMCHMRVNEKYRVWHGLCHMDDALMAPLNINHFDGYNNQDENSTLSPFEPLEHVPELNQGGWHDAGDYDLRVETQASTVRTLTLMYEAFNINYDQTLIDQKHHLVEIHHPDGKPDVLQQIEHGVLSILGGYRSLGRLYRGIICPTLRQYVMLGDAASATDNKIFDNKQQKQKIKNIDGLWYKKVANRYSNLFDPDVHDEMIQEVVPELDDRLVFTETNPARQMQGATALAAAYRVLKDYKPDLASECLQTAETLWEEHKDKEGRYVQATKIDLLTELFITTKKSKYREKLCSMEEAAAENIGFVGWSIGRILSNLDCPSLDSKLTQAIKSFSHSVDSTLSQNPFGAQHDRFHYVGMNYYYLHKAWPNIFKKEHLINALNYQLGCHPGQTTTSLVSGVGTNSPVVAYGTNRADWSYIPGGTFWGGFNILTPDLPENKTWPFFWQEREYITNGACTYMFSVLAVDQLLSE
ncbi:MAG: glycoside hydrolase family 9 protein [Candidatus Marinimicrobia bacterium]|nr:glycoside hydrolase family 9 protein [Candidatus Neomarinimicrobiota bacterium]